VTARIRIVGGIGQGDLAIAPRLEKILVLGQRRGENGPTVGKDDLDGEIRSGHSLFLLFGLWASLPWRHGEMEHASDSA
jgi:hypothetical protein